MEDQNHQSWLRRHRDSLQKYIDQLEKGLYLLEAQLRAIKKLTNPVDQSSLIAGCGDAMQMQRKTIERLQQLKQQAEDQLKRSM